MISFLYVPLLLHALETDAYAIWLTLTSIVSWIVMFDIGIGNGLRNKLSEAIARQEYDDAKSYVSTAYISIVIIGLFIIILFIGSIKLLNWTSIINATNFSKNTIDILVLIVGISFIFHFILGLINSILLALKLPAISSAIGCIGQVISYLIVVLLVTILHKHNIIILCSVISLTPVLTLIIANCVLFKGRYSYIRPSISYFDKKKLKSIFTLGLNFFWLQIITIVLFQLNNLIITHTVGNTAVVQYNICYKYLYTIVTIYTLICTPFWSATTYEFTIGNMKWIDSINKKLIAIALFLSVIGIIMTITSSTIYRIWLGNDRPHILMSTNILMLIYCIFMMLYSANGYLINGIGKLKLQTIITTILAVIYLPAAIIGGKYWGLNGVVLALTINAMINSIWSFIQIRKIVNGTATGIWLK